MSGLITAVAPVPLPSEALPPYVEHHRAKHRLLEEYMKVWFAKLAQTFPQVAVIDGFASAGRYRDQRVGSPLIFLHGYLDHAARDNFRAPPHFVFIEAKRSFAQHLCSEIEALPDLAGATVEVIHGEYEDRFPLAVGALVDRYQADRLPTFAFVDPRGYAKTPFTLLRDYRARLGRTAESMVYLPTSFMARFMGTEITAQALDRAFGSRAAWERIGHAAEPGAEASARLAAAYADVLRTEYQLVSRFAVDPTSRNRYYLYFATDHIDGLKAMKAAYWKVDPEDGRGYRQDVLTARGQGELFAPAVETPKAPEEDLAELVAIRFANRELTIEEAELFALTDTGFRETHVRTLALQPLEAAGLLSVVRRGTKGFPAGTTMRLRPTALG